MKRISYSGYWFPPEIIHRAIWLYLRFTLSLRDVEDLLAERGITVSYESVRRWVNHFGPMITAPASRSACTVAESRRVTCASHRGEPWPVGMSAVSMMSLIAIGMPSIGDSGLPAYQRAVEASAALAAPALFNVTKAPIAPS